MIEPCTFNRDDLGMVKLAKLHKSLNQLIAAFNDLTKPCKRCQSCGMDVEQKHPDPNHQHNMFMSKADMKRMMANVPESFHNRIDTVQNDSGHGAIPTTKLPYQAPALEKKQEQIQPSYVLRHLIHAWRCQCVVSSISPNSVFPICVSCKHPIVED